MSRNHPLPVPAEAARHITDDDLQRLGQQHLGQMERVEREGGLQSREARLVGGAGVLPALGGVVLDGLRDVDVGC
ncbi:hypothetical protein ACGFZR_14860 [Streptomyces sp. NPDC048241]|uniref:hypothetical protein n=1 Tax=Streptomyces sp. NPDC048241 TaxID=3365521 RepID=UPI0037126E7B